MTLSTTQSLVKSSLPVLHTKKNTLISLIKWYLYYRSCKVITINVLHFSKPFPFFLRFIYLLARYSDRNLVPWDSQLATRWETLGTRSFSSPTPLVLARSYSCTPMLAISTKSRQNRSLDKLKSTYVKLVYHDAVVKRGEREGYATAWQRSVSRCVTLAWDYCSKIFLSRASILQHLNEKEVLFNFFLYYYFFSFFLFDGSFLVYCCSITCVTQDNSSYKTVTTKITESKVTRLVIVCLIDSFTSQTGRKSVSWSVELSSLTLPQQNAY